MIKDNEIPAKLDDCETPVVELGDRELEQIQGGVGFTPEEREEAKKIIDAAAEHHGVNLRSVLIQTAIGTVIGFGANAAGRAVGNKVNNG